MTAIDKFQGNKKSYEMPSNQMFDITPSDVTELAIIPRAIYIGTSGDLSVTDEFDNDITLLNTFQGTILPIRVKKVLATGTTAGALVGLV